MKKDRYAQDGVDVKEEASFSSYAGSVCKQSYANSPFMEVHDLSQGQFRGPRPVTFKNLPTGYLLEASADGLGTKGVLIDAANAYETAAYDLVAMVATDITRYGGLPLFLTNILDTISVGNEGDEVNDAHKRLVIGLGEAARASGVVVLKGETAQMGVCVGSDLEHSPTRFNWGATMFGVYHPDRIITGNALAPGQKVVALRERGFRCNGISSVRKALRMHYGEEWWNNADAAEDIRKAAAPSVLYDTYVATLSGWYDEQWQPEVQLRAITHISGGGIREKFGHDLLFSRGYSAVLDNLFEPLEIMQKCAKWRELTDEEFYSTWNGGQGMLLVVDASDVDRCIARAKDFDIEAQVCGEITKEKSPSLVIHSRLSDSIITYT